MAKEDSNQKAKNMTAPETKSDRPRENQSTIRFLLVPVLLVGVSFVLAYGVWRYWGDDPMPDVSSAENVETAEPNTSEIDTVPATVEEEQRSAVAPAEADTDSNDSSGGQQPGLETSERIRLLEERLSLLESSSEGTAGTADEAVLTRIARIESRLASLQSRISGMDSVETETVRDIEARLARLEEAINASEIGEANPLEKAYGSLLLAIALNQSFEEEWQAFEALAVSQNLSLPDGMVAAAGRFAQNGLPDASGLLEDFESLYFSASEKSPEGAEKTWIKTLWDGFFGGIRLRRTGGAEESASPATALQSLRVGDVASALSLIEGTEDSRFSDWIETARDWLIFKDALETVGMQIMQAGE